MTTEMLIQVLLAVLGFFGVLTLNDVKNTIKEATKSIEELNIKVAVVIERTEHHAEEIEKIKDNQHRLNNLVQGIHRE